MQFSEQLIPIASFVTFATLSLGGELAAQAAASQNHFMVATELANGAIGNSRTFKMCAAVGNGAVPSRMTSANFVLKGGYIATLDAPNTGRPWLAGVLPRFATPRSAATLSLYGTELNLGPAPTVRVGGVTATRLSRAQDKITARMGFQPEPGWQPVSVSNGFGTSTVVKGIGILPMLMTEPAPASNKAFQIVFKGSQNDQVIWALSPFTAAPLRFPGFLYGLVLHPSAMVILPGFTIPSASGEMRIPIPATAYVGPVYVQAVFGTTNPGYGPVSFSNVLAF